jgi:hypothetical protein
MVAAVKQLPDDAQGASAYQLAPYTVDREVGGGTLIMFRLQRGSSSSSSSNVNRRAQDLPKVAEPTYNYRATVMYCCT